MAKPSSWTAAYERGLSSLWPPYEYPALAKFLSLSARDQRFVCASGCDLIADSGEVYADWIAGFGSVNVSHNPPTIVWVLSESSTH